MKKNRVFIITARSGFPNGFGAASILRKYVKGFKLLGFLPEVLLLRPSEKKGDEMNTVSEGTYEECKFKYFCGSYISPDNKLKRMLMYIRGVLSAVFYICRNRREINRVLFYSPDFYYSVSLITRLCHIFKINCIGIKTESSECDGQRKRNDSWKKTEKKIYNLFNTMLVISAYLEEQIKSYGYTGRTVVLPILVDETMYDGINHEEDDCFITYVGSINYIEEIRAIHDICDYLSREHSEWKMRIIGKEMVECEELKTLHQMSNALFTGPLGYSEIPRYLLSSKILILPRAKTEYSNAGFPIKLGEYLLTGKPVIATNVGELSNYLCDKKDVFLSEPNNIDSFCKNIDYVINNMSDALEIGAEGRKSAIKHFGLTNICKVIMDL